MKSWKTTTTGILAIVVAVGTAIKTYLATGAIPDIGALIAAVSAGIGLISARDNGVTSEQAGAK